MSKYVPLYSYSVRDAQECGEMDKWRESHQENKRCARAIESAIENGFHDNHLDEDCAKKIIDEFGFNRVNYVLKINTRLIPKEDPRISTDNRQWGAVGYITSGNIRDEYRINKHPLLVSGFISEARKEWDKLGLFEAKHCVDSDEPMNYEDKLLVLSPDVLKDEYKTPKDQLFLAKGGFGCHPDKIGTKVFGYFLKDGENTHFARGDFLGVLKDEYIPDWAREKLSNQSEESEDIGEDESEGIGVIS